MSTIIWTKAATADLERHYDFWESIDSDLAKKVVQEIIKKGESLKDNPRRGTIIQQAQVDARSDKLSQKRALYSLQRFL
jgi:plasmid stabilization system protein ParE